MLARAPSVGSTQCGAIKVPPGQRDATLKKLRSGKKMVMLGITTLWRYGGGVLCIPWLTFSCYSDWISPQPGAVPCNEVVWREVFFCCGF